MRESRSVTYPVWDLCCTVIGEKSGVMKKENGRTYVVVGVSYVGGLRVVVIGVNKKKKKNHGNRRVI